MIAIIGGHGLVGKEIQKLLLELGETNIILVGRGDPIPFASTYFVATSSESAKAIVPNLPSSARVIDLSSAHRKSWPLILPSANGHLLKELPLRIATPNCVVAILLTALAPIHKQTPITSIYLSTYQAASGAGKIGLEALDSDKAMAPFPHPFTNNVFLHEAAASEEAKIEFETKKILNCDSLTICVRSVRVPVKRAHSLSAFVTFAEEPDFSKVSFENLQFHHSPTPLIARQCKDIFLSPIRKSAPKTYDFWLVGDQLLRGAALTAVECYNYNLNLI